MRKSQVRGWRSTVRVLGAVQRIDVDLHCCRSREKLLKGCPDDEMGRDLRASVIDVRRLSSWNGLHVIHKHLAEINCYRS